MRSLAFPRISYGALPRIHKLKSLALQCHNSTKASKTNKNDEAELQRIIQSSNMGFRSVCDTGLTNKNDKLTDDVFNSSNNSTYVNAGNEFNETKSDFKNEVLTDYGSNALNLSVNKTSNFGTFRDIKRTDISRIVQGYVNSFHSTILTASKTINDISGYTEIEKLKQEVQNLEHRLKEYKEKSLQYKNEYAAAINVRSESQKEMNELLTRKHNWSPQDLERFTTLYRSNHANEIAEEQSQKRLDEAEKLVDKTQTQLTHMILCRYHEEQIWSDKIRRFSTWGTVALMIMNFLLFGLATFIVEPWKRNKMVDAFEQKLKTTMDNKEVMNINKPLENYTSGLSTKTSVISEALEKGNTTVPEVSHSKDSINRSDTSSIHVFSFPKTYSTIFSSLKKSWNDIISMHISTIQISKFDFSLTLSSVGCMCWCIGFLCSYIIFV